MHWNFFFTIGLLPPFGYAVYGLTSHVSFGALAVLLAFGASWACLGAQVEGSGRWLTPRRFHSQPTRLRSSLASSTGR